MKKLLKLVFAGLLLSVASCTEERVEPQPLTEDLKTTANGYWDQYFSIHIATNYEDDVSYFFLTGTGGNITVDWGDGSRERVYVGEEYVGLEHDYNREEDNPGTFVIRISGDIKTIDQVEWHYQGFYINSMHFGGLTNLKHLRMGELGHGPPVINLSKNKLVETVDVGGVQRLADLILPTSNKIRMLDISGWNELSTADVDRIIARVHDSVVNSPRSGYVNLPFMWGQDEDDYSLIGPPSSYSLTKLRKLRDRYGWGIYPEIN